ncbi:MAG: glyoxalase [Micavibrio aeruginosavorus]|uniref:Glyoxalase n=1 Tax=Micavibrio aeruginosavorus TaxID=349221 RepID=A0A2W5N194_9BACT|nr:MAG: glyoxalase [Micavibrio aeruginosavorus]
MAQFYPTLVTDKLVSTVNFYEDYFGFVPAVEQDGYALLQNVNDPHNKIAVFDKTHRCVADFNQAVQGVILSIAVDDVDQAYDTLYMEGLEVYKELGTDVHGTRHFVVYDPNRILVNVLQAEKAEMRLAAE